jgi:hypothetical protein
MVSIIWTHPSILPKFWMKVAKTPHTTSLHPQKYMHHKSQGMTKNHTENDATSHPQINM